MDQLGDNSDPAATPLARLDNEPSDTELVSRVRAGETDAFEELFHRHRRRVSLIASRFFRQREQIEEIVQESFTKAYFALADFSNQQETSFASWLARIAFNACYDELRRVKRRPDTSTTADISEAETLGLREQLRDRGPDIEAGVIARDLATKLLARLSPEDRLVLVMLDVEGMSTGEIAQATNWSVSKVKVRAHRARQALRRVLERFL